MKHASTTKLNLPASYIECFKNLQTVSQKNKVHYILVGAYARDIVFEHYLGISSQRLTTDIDIGLSVDSWEEFNIFKASLIELGFEGNTNNQQRLSYNTSNSTLVLDEAQLDLVQLDPVQLDIVPHGGINTPNNEIGWPPDGSTVMSVLGFQEAYDSALTLPIDDDLSIRVISVPGLGLLKLIAWLNRPSNRRPKDALDFEFSLRHYDALPNINEAIFDEGFAQKYEFDMDKAICAKFGYDVRSISSQQSTDVIIEKLFSDSQETVFEQFVLDMSPKISSDDLQRQNNYEMLCAFRDGFMNKI